MDQQERQVNTVDPDLQFEALIKKIRDSGHNMDLGRITNREIDELDLRRVERYRRTREMLEERLKEFPAE